MKTSYGLDLAGFSAGKSALAKAMFDETLGLRVVVERNHVFSRKLEGQDLIKQQLQDERELLQCLKPLYVDVPIDLRGLPTPEGYTFTWELTKRPVDFALDALPPLADRIGTPVARMQNVLRGATPGLLGTQLFETYPKASLNRLFGTVPSYKGQTAEYSENTWVGDGLADILRRLKATSEEGTVLNDDHLDASICALVGVVPTSCLLQDDELENEVRRCLEKKVRRANRHQLVTTLPKGYVLLKEIPAHALHIALVEEFTP